MRSQQRGVVPAGCTSIAASSVSRTSKQSATHDEIAPGVEVVPLPGHDDGHVGLLVGEDSLIVADAVPHPAQLDHPEWTFAYDEDLQLAVETRRRILDESATGRSTSATAREGIRR